MGRIIDSFKAGEWHGQICILESCSDCSLENVFELEESIQVYANTSRRIVILVRKTKSPSHAWQFDTLRSLIERGMWQVG